MHVAITHRVNFFYPASAQEKPLDYLGGFLFQKQPRRLILTPPPPKNLHSYLLNPGSNVVSLGEHILTKPQRCGIV